MLTPAREELDPVHHLHRRFRTEKRVEAPDLLADGPAALRDDDYPSVCVAVRNRSPVKEHEISLVCCDHRSAEGGRELKVVGIASSTHADIRGANDVVTPAT